MCKVSISNTKHSFSGTAAGMQVIFQPVIVLCDRFRTTVPTNSTEAKFNLLCVQISRDVCFTVNKSINLSIIHYSKGPFSFSENEYHISPAAGGVPGVCIM